MTVKEKREEIRKLCDKVDDCSDCRLEKLTTHYQSMCGDLPDSIVEEVYSTLIDKKDSTLEAVIPVGHEFFNFNAFPADPIKPSYYNDTKFSPFDVIDDWGLNFYFGNAVKYIKRAGKKANNSRLQDLKKIREYIDHEIAMEEVSG